MELVSSLRAGLGVKPDDDEAVLRLELVREVIATELPGGRARHRRRLPDLHKIFASPCGAIELQKEKKKKNTNSQLLFFFPFLLMGVC